MPLDQQQQSAPANLLQFSPVAAPPNVTSSTVSIASDTVQYTVAARALLKRADRYTESNLMAFPADKYPQIPEEHRHSLMIGEVTGAQTAAQRLVLLDGTKTGKDKASCVTAEGAQRMLSFYNPGLVSEAPFDPNPQVRVSPTEPTPFTFEEPMEKEPETPEPDEGTSRDSEHQPSDEQGEDAETSSKRAIELIRLEVSETKPCNRQDRWDRKRTRSSSPSRSPRRAALTREQPVYPPLDERIRHEPGLPTKEEVRAKHQGTRSSGSPESPPPSPPTKKRKI